MWKSTKSKGGVKGMEEDRRKKEIHYWKAKQLTIGAGRKKGQAIAKLTNL